MNLGSTFLVSSLVVTLGFGLTGLSVSQLNRTNQTSFRQRAENQADSALSLAIEKVLADPNFGENGQSPVLRVEHEDAVGLLTFDRSRAAELHITPSDYNLKGLTPLRAADDGVVPPEAIRLVAEGRCRGVVRRVEVVLHQPAFPYALAASGRIESQGRLRIAAADTLENVGDALEGESALPADLLANGAREESIQLLGETSIAGDVQTSGGLKMGPAKVSILGHQRLGAEPTAIPEVKLADFDPAERPHTRLSEPSMTAPTMVGLNRRTGNLAVQGDLTLDTALLYVEGNVTLTGGLKGHGALIATGNVTVTNACGLEAGNRLALLAGGDLTLTGQGQATSFLQGVVCAGGDVHASQVTVVGTLLAPGKKADQEVVLQDSALVSLTDLQTLSLDASLDIYRSLAANPQQRGQGVPPEQVPQNIPGPMLRPPERRGGDSEAIRAVRTGKVPGELKLTLPGRAPSAPMPLEDLDAAAALLASYLNFQPGEFMIQGELKHLTSPRGLLDEIIRRTGGLDKGGAIVVDPSKFLKPADRFRVLVWRDVTS